MDGFIYRIIETMFIEEDVNVLGCLWKKVPYYYSKVCITLLYLLHSQDGPASIV
jgi:hypothetical protein